jgi:hypothetical protein
MAIRATIDVVRLSAVVSLDTSGSIDAVATNYSAEINFQRPTSDITYQLANVSELVANYDSDNRILREAIPVSDITFNLVTKDFSEALNSTDLPKLGVTLNKTDSVTNSDLFDRVVSFNRQFTELLDATDDFYGAANIDDDQVMWLLKSIPVERLTIADVDSLEVGKNFTEAQSVSDDDNLEVGKNLDEPLSASEQVSYDYAKGFEEQLDATDDLDGIATTEDDQTAHLYKFRTDAFSTADSEDIEFGKNPTDTVPTSDVIGPFNVDKALTDNPQATEFYSSAYSKPLSDSYTVSDTTDVQGIKNLTEQLYHADGTSFWDNYVDPTYMVTGYAGTWIPEFDVTKVRTDTATFSESLTYSMTYNRTLTDSVNVTDDLDGAITSEDDQTMLFHKGLSDITPTSDSTVFVMRMSQADVAAFSDSLSHLTSKGLIDSFTFADTTYSDVGKSLSDTATTSDSISNVTFSKALSDIVDATDDFDGAATIEDDQTMSFTTSRAESIQAADSSSQAAGKGLADSANTGDSGSLRMTDYCDVLYTSEVYTGISANF